MKQLLVISSLFLVFLAATVFLPTTNYQLPTIYAQSSGSCVSTGTSSVRAQNGLVSSPQVQQNLVNEGGFCIIDPKAAFAPYKIPSYDDLKSLYYDQAKQISGVTREVAKTGDYTHSDIPMTGTNDHLYYIKKTTAASTDGNLTISGNISGNQTGVVFVDGNLTIGPIPGNKLQGNNNTGLVFIVKGNVNIHQSVDQIDAVIISEGIICTAFDGTSCPAVNVSASQLTINGSLISLKESAPIRFNRSFANNAEAAEQINHQVKYLVILRSLLSDTFQRWSEIP